jgi:hypothetical protein
MAMHMAGWPGTIWTDGRFSGCMCHNDQLISNLDDFIDLKTGEAKRNDILNIFYIGHLGGNSLSRLQIWRVYPPFLSIGTKLAEEPLLN